MSTPVSYAELEIGVSAGLPAAAGQPPRYRVQLRFDDPEDAAARPPVSGEASIDPEKLIALQDELAGIRPRPRREPVRNEGSRRPLRQGEGGGGKR